MRTAAVILVVVVLACLAPLGAVMAASAIAEQAGCRLDEGSVHACIIWGADWGGALYTAFVSGWFMLLTLPVAALAALALVMLVLIDALRRFRARS